MDDNSQIALITGFASIAGGFVSQLLGIYFQGRMNNLERVRIIEGRASQLYLREISAYDALVPGLAGLLYICRDLCTQPLFREKNDGSAEKAERYEQVQSMVRELVGKHLEATAAHYHIIGPEGSQQVDAVARKLFGIIDELTDVISGGEPVTEERCREILESLEQLRLDTLAFCWSALDVQDLERSFHTIKSKHTDLREVRVPKILNKKISRL